MKLRLAIVTIKEKQRIPIINFKQKSNNYNMARLTKSQTDKMLFGVCGGLAEYFGMDSTIMRIIFVALAIVGVGSPVLIYLIMAIVMPRY